MSELRLQDRKAVLTGGGRGLRRRSFTGPADARVPGEVVAFVEEAAEALSGLGAPKAALVMATRCLAVALAPRIRVNAVARG